MRFALRDKIFAAKPARLLRTMTAQRDILKLCGRAVGVTIYQVTRKTFAQLGLNPNAFVPGVKVYVLDNKNFASFSEWMREAPPSPSTASIPPLNSNSIIEIPIKEISPSKNADFKPAGALYPLSKRGEHDGVRNERLPFLPPHSRNIVLQEGFSRIELLHELMHDQFLSCAFSADMRKTLVLLVAQLIKKAYNKKDAGLLKFFEEVNNRCKFPC